MDFKQFDIVRLRTTRNVPYLCAKPGVTADPNGNWSVAMVYEEELLLTKDEITIRIPKADVQKIASYNLGTALNNLKGILGGKRQRQETEN